jgi:hypothetical protein
MNAAALVGRALISKNPHPAPVHSASMKPASGARKGTSRRRRRDAELGSVIGDELLVFVRERPGAPDRSSARRAGP